MLDCKDPATKKSFRDILMSITAENKPGTMLFHSIDRQFKSDIIVNFQFHPEHASKANNLIAGLVPYLKDHGHHFHLKMFSPEALQRKAKAKWNRTTREADSETDAELANLLAEDDDLNFTDKPTLDKVIVQHNPQKNKDESNPLVSVQVPAFPTEPMPSMNPDKDSVSSFHPGPTINLTDDPDSDKESNNNKSSQKSLVSILRTSRVQEADEISRISMSDSATRISSLETEISMMDKTFRDEIGKLQSQAAQQAHAQSKHGTILSKILLALKKIYLAALIEEHPPLGV